MEPLPKDELLKEFGKNLRKARLKNDMSQEEFANLAGFDRTYISHVERGIRNPTLFNAYCLARALNLDLNDLIPD